MDHGQPESGSDGLGQFLGAVAFRFVDCEVAGLVSATTRDRRDPITCPVVEPWAPATSGARLVAGWSLNARFILPVLPGAFVRQFLSGVQAQCRRRVRPVQA
jgi:hypothetical protein